ncbi:ABC transporter permease [Streptomyces nigrescens]|uniref:ABC transporter permease n=2 Tax=Streptomyces TaxID=1883 RepID=A0A640TTR4_STRNI|nr:ABC transporter permease [Streptomyces libani]WAU00620.1 ABC transporter permease [Streptomyces libani subsp. libani]GFE26470.1 metal transporter [Streptomyces libani subsp. libani]GGW07194.1 metal transporter [Streptomyces libani subsp. libani]
MAGPLSGTVREPATGVDGGPTAVRPLRPVLSAVLRTGGLFALLARRMLLLAALLAAVFAAIELLPGDAATATAERGESPADLGHRRHLLGLDRPVLTRFADWMTGLPTGDLGTSAHGEAVAGLLARPFPNTLLLGGLALLVTLVVSLGLGCLAALKPGRLTDRAVSATATGILALPEFVVAVALVLVFALWADWLPAVTLTGADGAPASWQMLVLPVTALSVPQIGWNTRIVRAALADEAKAPHMETALIDGLPRHRIFTHHLLPGALPTIAAGLATSTGMLLGGAVVVETIFNYPGIGGVLAGAVADRDSPVVAGVVAVTGAVITGVLLLADLIRAWASGGRI